MLSGDCAYIECWNGFIWLTLTGLSKKNLPAVYTDYLIIVIFFDINLCESDIDFNASVFELNFL